LSTKLHDAYKTFGHLLLSILCELKAAPQNSTTQWDMSLVDECAKLILSKLKEHVPDTARSDEDKRHLEQLRLIARQLVHFAGEKGAKVEMVVGRMLQMGQQLHQFHSEMLSFNGGADEKSAGEQQVAEKAQVEEIMQKLSRLHNNLHASNGSAYATADSDPSQLNSNGNGEEGKADSGNHNHFFNEGASPQKVCSKRFVEELASKLGPDEAARELISEIDQRSLLNSGIDQDTVHCVSELIVLIEITVADEEDDVGTVLQSLTNLLHIVKSAAESTLQSKMAVEDKDRAELYQTINKLKILLTTKREQVSSLRSVLRSNKTSAEGALQCLRDKYESEKRLKDESMDTLRKELKQFKEDAATFASARAMFTARCEELNGWFVYWGSVTHKHIVIFFSAKLESAQEGLRAAEEEKKTLNQLLRMAIQQKLHLTQRMEDIEVDRERHRESYKRTNPRNTQQQQQQQQTQREVKAVKYPYSNGSSRGGK